jgi:hypothetical protein
MKTSCNFPGNSATKRSRKEVSGEMFAQLCRRRQRLCQIGQNVVDVLDADAQPDGVWRDACGGQFGLGELAMGGGGGMRRQRLGIADVDQPLKQLERIVEFYASGKTTLDAKGEQGRGRPPVYFCASS